MNFLDRLIGWFNPQAGAEREAWRQALEEIRHYDAGSYGRPNANWYAINQSAEYTDRYSRDTVRARARDMERNSDIMASVISPFIRNVVGKGVILQAETGNADLNKEISIHAPRTGSDSASCPPPPPPLYFNPRSPYGERR